MSYEHIFFDLDRTLWDFETNSHETLTELSVKYNLIEKGVTSFEDFIQLYLKINERKWDEYRKGIIDKHTLRYTRFQEALMGFNISDKTLSDNLADDYVNYSPLKTNLFPHTKEVLDYLSDKYQLHIITNGFEEIQHIKLKNSGIGNYFDEIITSEKAGFKKPDVRIFNYSLEAVNTTAAKSIMIGDNLEADIVGARNAGLHQVFFNPENEIHTEEVTFEIESLKELIGIL